MCPDSSEIPPELAREVRSLLRNAGLRGLAVSALLERFGPERGPGVLTTLVARGIVDAAGTTGHHRVTEAGRRYASGRGSSLFTRKACERALQGFLVRCDELARSPGSLCVPTRVLLAGEMLGEAPQLRSVDLALELTFTATADERVQSFLSTGREPLLLGSRSYRDVESWRAAAANAAVLYLRARSPILDVSRRIAMLAPDVPHRVVFDVRGSRPSVPPSRK